MEYRSARPDDARPIAALHADSWRRHYRGSYSDAFLDAGVDADRLGVWSDRLRAPDPSARTVVAQDGPALVGFVHTVLDADAVHGALLDNLHVAHDRQGLGVGAALMASAARAVVDDRPGQAMHLWVLEQNRRAQAFYERHHGACVESERSEAPGGGTITGLRYLWTDPSVLLGP